jgi:hypothetical protein
MPKTSSARKSKIIKSTNLEGKLTWLLRFCGEAQLSDIIDASTYAGHSGKREQR